MLGPDHPEVARSLNSLSVLYASQDSFGKAHDLQKKAQNIDSKIIDQVMGFTSERQKLKFLYLKNHDLYAYISLISQYMSKNQSARKDALNVWLKRKGVTLEAQRRFQDALVYSDDQQAVKTFHELSRVRAKLSKIAYAGPGEEGLASYKQKEAYLKERKEKLEAKLSQISQIFVLGQKIAKADCEKIAATLPKNTALIEFARVDMYNFKAKGKEKKWLPAHYLAFVLHAGKGDKIGMIDLGDAEEIDKTIVEFKEEILDFRDITDITAFKSSKKMYELILMNS